MKNVLLFSLGAISCLILSHTFIKHDESDKIISQSTLSNTLLTNCSNELMFNIPADANVSYSCDNGQVIATGQKNKIILRPDSTDQAVVLKLNYNGKTYTQQYKSINPPEPKIKIMYNGSPLDFKIGVPAPGPRAITIMAEADDFFKKTFPIDSRYNITEWHAMVVRGKRPVAQLVFTIGAGNLTSFSTVTQPNDRILIEITGITRTNFQGKVEKVPLGTLCYNLPLQ